MSSRAQDVAGRPLTRDLQSVIDDGTKHAAAFAAMIVPSRLLPPFTVTSR
jgi:hypothetical protein